jgi:hypothetical protein
MRTLNPAQTALDNLTTSELFTEWQRAIADCLELPRESELIPDHLREKRQGRQGRTACLSLADLLDSQRKIDAQNRRCRLAMLEVDATVSLRASYLQAGLTYDEAQSQIDQLERERSSEVRERAKRLDRLRELAALGETSGAIEYDNPQVAIDGLKRFLALYDN